MAGGGGFPGVAELGVRTQEPPTPSEQEESGPTTGHQAGGAQGRGRTTPRSAMLISRLENIVD
jgi:hypothetical protein